jgi:hypothetical protein
MPAERRPRRGSTGPDVVFRYQRRFESRRENGGASTAPVIFAGFVLYFFVPLLQDNLSWV